MGSDGNIDYNMHDVAVEEDGCIVQYSSLLILSDRFIRTGQL